ncbi:MAG: hypothetical protein ABJA10_08845, partial [Aestuariivirga sp.]
PSLINQNRSGEISWLVYLARCLDIKLKSSCYEGLFGETDPLLALQVADLDNQDLVQGKINYATWDLSLNSEGLDDEMWLYSYQAVLSGFRKPKGGDKFIRSHKYFEPMFVKSVHFYKPEENQLAYLTSVKALKKENSFNKAQLLKFVSGLDIDVDSLGDFEDPDEFGEEY